MKNLICSVVFAGCMISLLDGFQLYAADSQMAIIDNPFRYSLYYHDHESGMDYCNARYYDPDSMQFLERDTYPVDNRYSYCNGNPVNSIDPTGHVREWMTPIRGPQDDLEQTLQRAVNVQRRTNVIPPRVVFQAFNEAINEVRGERIHPHFSVKGIVPISRAVAEHFNVNPAVFSNMARIDFYADFPGVQPPSYEVGICIPLDTISKDLFENFLSPDYTNDCNLDQFIRSFSFHYTNASLCRSMLMISEIPGRLEGPGILSLSGDVREIIYKQIINECDGRSNYLIRNERSQLFKVWTLPDRRLSPASILETIKPEPSVYE